METVRVIYHHEADGWWAESPDVEDWSAAGDTYAEVVKLAEEGIPFSLGFQGSCYAAEWSRTITPLSGHKALKLRPRRLVGRKTARRAKSNPVDSG